MFVFLTRLITSTESSLLCIVLIPYIFIYIIHIKYVLSVYSVLCTVLVIGDIVMKMACDICSYKVHSPKDLCLRQSRYSIKLVYQFIWIISFNGHSCSENKK